MKVFSLKTGQEIYGVIYNGNPSQIQEILNQPKVLSWHNAYRCSQQYMEPLLVTFNLCYFQKNDTSSDEYSYLFNEVPENHFVVGVFQEVVGKNHIYILQDLNNHTITLNRSIFESEAKNITVRNFVENFLLINQKL